MTAWPDDAEAVTRAVIAALASDGIIVYPTETFYGLGVGVSSEIAVSRLFAIKGRDPANPLPFIAESTAAVCEIATLDARAERLAARAWPGPLTLVLPARPGLMRLLVGAAGTVAVRVSSHAVATAVAAAAGGVVTSTSANRSGEAPAASMAAARSSLESSLGAHDVCIDAGTTAGGPPSTIVDMSSAEPRLLRDGAVPWSRVLEFLQ